MRFATRVLILQLAAATLVVAVCVAAFAALGIRQLRAETEAMALGIARTAASHPEVQQAVASYAGASEPDPVVLAASPLQQYALAVAELTGALFVVIADDEGLRLAHPEPARLGQRVSTEYEAVLAGNELVEWESGTLGPSVRAKVPVRTPGGDVAGEVSVGFAPERAFADVPALVALSAAIAAVALAVGVVVAFGIRRRLERLTRGVQPDELGALLQSRAALLEGVHDGVLTVSADRVVQACNPAAGAVLELDAHRVTGRTIDELDLPPRLRRPLEAALAGARAVQHGELVLEERVAFFEVRSVRHGEEDLGAVVVLRDRTDVAALAQRLDAVRAATTALRVQRHEFANRMHVASGMLAAGRVDETRALLGEFADRGALPEEAGVHVGEPLLRSFLAAKAIEAAERGVELRLGDDTLVLGTVAEPEDVAAVLGNLIDNAVAAAVAGSEPRWVEVTLLDDGEQLALTVADSGAGIEDPDRVFERARAREDEESAAPDAVHGRGIGLPLARRFSRRRGGELWVVSPGGDGHGAVFGARLPGVMRQGAADADGADGADRADGTDRAGGADRVDGVDRGVAESGGRA
jgi:two-component system CitB family sensor kinase